MPHSTVEDLKQRIKETYSNHMKQTHFEVFGKRCNEFDSMVDELEQAAFQAGISYCAEAVRLEKKKWPGKKRVSTNSIMEIGWNKACDALAAKIAEIGGKS